VPIEAPPERKRIHFHFRCARRAAARCSSCTTCARRTATR
jgi:hypothetical protein